MTTLSPSAAQRVTVILPCRNEAAHIAACLDSILASAHPADRLEVLVVDGMSDDGTRALVAQYADAHPSVHMLDNPGRIVPTALNIGIQAATGDIIVRMDGHVVYPPEYIPRLVDALLADGADNVGGCLVTLPADGTAVAQAIAIAMSHPFGVGFARFRIGARQAQDVDTVPFGCFRRSLFARVGMFDEELVRNQDDEFNHRIIRGGGRVRLIPDVVCYYYARGSLRKAARMFYQYGAFKPLVARKVGRVMTVRQLVPALFVATLIGTAAGALVAPAVGLLGAAIATLYAGCVGACALSIARSHGVRCALALAAALPVVHLSYGFGFLRGLRAGVLGRSRWRDPSAVPLSR
jgi:glycosyltransferase involved in cell wall biosynthesis